MKKLLVLSALFMISGAHIFGNNGQQPRISNDDIRQYIQLKNKIALAMVPIEPELYAQFLELQAKLEGEVRKLESSISASPEYATREVHARLLQLKTALNY